MRVLMAAALLLAATAAGAQEGQTERPKPCSAEVHRQFDFWAGSWDVHNKDGKHVGENTIVSHGCWLAETWKGNGGSRGMSLNFVDAATGKWTQDWVDNGGGRIVIEGGWSGGAMTLTGEHILPDGTRRPFRGIWTPLEDGRVRQLFEEVADEQAGWATWFDGYYTKRED